MHGRPRECTPLYSSAASEVYKRRDWDAQINFFSNKFSVIAPTLRGHDGKNTKERQDFIIENLGIIAIIVDSENNAINSQFTEINSFQDFN